MLAKHKPQPVLDLDGDLAPQTQSFDNEALWVPSESTLTKALTAKRKKGFAVQKELDYLELCKKLKLIPKQFQIFEVEDKQRLSLLCQRFESWIKESNIDLKHLIAPSIFWQQFDLASVSPSNFNVEAIEDGKYTFQEMPLFEPRNIFYFKGGDLGNLLFDDTDKDLNVQTGNDQKYQFHLVKAVLHPLFIKYLESN